MRRPLEFLRRCLTLASLVALCACEGAVQRRATDVVVVVYSDLVLERELTSISVEVRDEDGVEATSKHEFPLDATHALPLSFGVSRPEGGAEWFMLVTRGLGADGKARVEYKVIAHFEPQKTGLLQIYLGSACIDNFCTEKPGQTCQGGTGRCEDVQQVYPPLYDGQDAGFPGLVSLDAGSDAWSDAGSDARIDAGSDVRSDAGLSTEGSAVAPNVAGFSSFGGRRSDGAIVVYDDGFERGERSCTADGQFCVTGGFEP